MRRNQTTEKFNSVVDGLKHIYNTKIKPLEKAYNYEAFHSAPLSDSDIEAKPMVLLLGQYSVGKSTFIKNILGKNYPGIHIGPEPTTDRFVAVMHGDERVIPGNAAVVQADKPFKNLNKYGNAFLSKFQVSMMPSPLLETMTFIDTPGVLSGEKQRIGRSYDFVEIAEWFAERADMILLLFDAHKLDISDEFKRVIHTLKGHDEKIRVIFNKSHMISTQQLMRVYGALMWSLGKVIKTPEVVRVYIGSFNGIDGGHDLQRLNLNDEQDGFYHQSLLKAEEKDLLNDLLNLPRNSAVRKINNIVRRARLAKVHALIISHLRKEMPTLFGKTKTQKNLIDNLEDVFTKIQRTYNISPGDFPDIERFRERLKLFDISQFQKLNIKMIQQMDDVLANDLPRLMEQFPSKARLAEMTSKNNTNPFSNTVKKSVDTSDPWSITSVNFEYANNVFDSLGLDGDKVPGSMAKDVFMESGLSFDLLAAIWNLADYDSDGFLSRKEFAVALHLIDRLLAGEFELPQDLPKKFLSDLLAYGDENDANTVNV
jgi:EH domain-containing protein 3/EH domain-containing protein 1